MPHHNLEVHNISFPQSSILPHLKSLPPSHINSVVYIFFQTTPMHQYIYFIQNQFHMIYGALQVAFHTGTQR